MKNTKVIEILLTEAKQVLDHNRTCYECHYDVTCSAPIVKYSDVDLGILNTIDEIKEHIYTVYKKKYNDTSFGIELVSFVPQYEGDCSAFIKGITFRSNGAVLKRAKIYLPKSTYDNDYLERSEELKRLTEAEFLKEVEMLS